MTHGIKPEVEHLLKILETLLECLYRRGEKEEITIMADVLVDIKIEVNPAGVPLAVDATGVPTTATVGVGYNGVLVASGGVPPYTFTDVSASQIPPTVGFPAGVALNADGTITGTPGTAGNFDAVVDVADSAGAVASARLTNKRR